MKWYRVSLKVTLIFNWGRIMAPNLKSTHFFILSLVQGVLIFEPYTAHAKKTSILPACSSEIFCRGDLLHAVQMARIFNDSKTFVDMRLKTDAPQVVQAFRSLGSNVTKKKLTSFVKNYFHPVGHDLDAWTPTDWQEKPKIVNRIKDENLKHFASELNKLWKKLGRKISDEARKSIARSSLIVVDKPFIVPGGRFREYYYWDSYWVVNGLLICGMKDTVKGMIDNFVHLVRTYGFVPNGGRIYYTNRSQPPFLIPIVDLYLNYTGDENYVKSVLGALEKEYSFWRQNRTIEVEVSSGKYNLAIYAADMNTPRPESYYEDVHTAMEVPDHAKPALYRDIASAAESGWDFSSRWFNRSALGGGTLSSIRTRKLVPTDLNSILFLCEKILEKLFRMAGDPTKAEMYRESSDARGKAIEAVLWDSESGLWLDYDRELKKRNTNFYAASIAPLWAGVHQGNKKREKVAVRSLKRLGVLDYPGGFPTSLRASGQQWDFPNAWPPLQHMLTEALARSRDQEIQQEALALAQKWISTNYKAWKATGHMFEKFNVSVQGAPGGGGEYVIQVGFGWTNGVILAILERYPDQMKIDRETPPQPTTMTVKAKGSFVSNIWINFVISCMIAFVLLFF